MFKGVDLELELAYSSPLFLSPQVSISTERKDKVNKQIIELKNR
jgi:hypothetical protein